MKKYPIAIKPFGNHTLLLEWPNEVDVNILDDILSFKEVLQNTYGPRFEYVASYNSLALIGRKVDFDFKRWETELSVMYQEMEQVLTTSRSLWKLPACYDSEFGLDIEEVAKQLQCSVDELIERHCSYEYTVFGIGFLPGFMYLGGLPKSLETRRKQTPRLHVPKGAVGLAGKQTGIYPQDSPGGWNIIGSCPIPIFNQEAEDPCFVNVGDKIKFVAIPRAEYELHKIEAEVGVYKFKKTELDA